MLGIGLNVSTERVSRGAARTATSLRLAGIDLRTSRRCSTRCSPRSSRRLAAEPADVLAAWRERDALRGRSVRWADGEGVAAGIDDAGALLVQPTPVASRSTPARCT